MHKFLLLGIWPLATVITLIVSISLSLAWPAHSTGKVKGAQTTNNVELRTNSALFTALPTTDNTIEQNLIISDARVEIVRQFLNRYDSPLLPYAKKLVETADLYNLDFRLLPAVAMQESGLCKIIPEGSHNCWGYGVYADKVVRFASYDEAIEKVGQGLSSDYIYEGLTTPEQIMNRYAPSSNGSWAEAVRHFMEIME